MLLADLFNVKTFDLEAAERLYADYSNLFNQEFLSWFDENMQYINFEHFDVVAILYEYALIKAIEETANSKIKHKKQILALLENVTVSANYYCTMFDGKIYALRDFLDRKNLTKQFCNIHEACLFIIEQVY